MKDCLSFHMKTLTYEGLITQPVTRLEKLYRTILKNPLINVH